MTPQEKTDLKNRISEKAAKRFWGREIHFLWSSVANVIDIMPETEITTEQAWNKIAEGYPKSPEAIANTCNNILKVMESSGNICVKNGNLVTTDFEKEVELPKVVAEYLDTVKGKESNGNIIYDLITDQWGVDEGYDNDEVLSWVCDSDNVLIIADALRYGYKEKEQLYIMPVPYTEEAYYFEISLIGVPKPAKKWEAQKFTLEEINEHFPKIAEFKEEVAE